MSIKTPGRRNLGSRTCDSGHFDKTTTTSHKCSRPYGHDGDHMSWTRRWPNIEDPPCPAVGHRAGPCDLVSGHPGLHISYGYNGTRVWGIDYGRQASS